MLKIPPYVAAKRFTTPPEKLVKLCEQRGVYNWSIYPDEWWTDPEWWRASQHRQAGLDVLYHTGESEPSTCGCSTSTNDDSDEI